MIPLKYFEPYVQSPMEHFGIFSLCLSRAKLKFNEKIRVNPENAYGIICQFKSSSTSIAHSLFAWKNGWDDSASEPFQIASKFERDTRSSLKYFPPCNFVEMRF